LLLRTLERAERIHRAMLARGFDGRLPVGQPLAWQWRDTLFLVGCLSLFVLMRSGAGGAA
jgi:cobalt/nickel transport system permease protein